MNNRLKKRIQQNISKYNLRYLNGVFRIDLSNIVSDDITYARNSYIKRYYISNIIQIIIGLYFTMRIL